MSEHRTFRITKPKRVVGLVLLGLLVVSAGVHFYFRFHIDGVYFDPYMACDCSWIFKDGQIYMETEKGRDHVATYTRSGSRWVCRGLASSESSGAIMQSSLLGVKWFDKGFQSGVKFMPRRCFSWYADVDDWFQNHLHIKI